MLGEFAMGTIDENTRQPSNYGATLRRPPTQEAHNQMLCWQFPKREKIVVSMKLIMTIRTHRRSGQNDDYRCGYTQTQ